MRCFINLISYLFLNSNFRLGRYNFHLHVFDTCFENAIAELEVGIEHLHQIWIHVARKFKECLQFFSFDMLLKVTKVFCPQP